MQQVIQLYPSSTLLDIQSHYNSHDHTYNFNGSLSQTLQKPQELEKLGNLVKVAWRIEHNRLSIHRKT